MLKKYFSMKSQIQLQSEGDTKAVFKSDARFSQAANSWIKQL